MREARAGVGHGGGGPAGAGSVDVRRAQGAADVLAAEDDQAAVGQAIGSRAGARLREGTGEGDRVRREGKALDQIAVATQRGGGWGRAIHGTATTGEPDAAVGHEGRGCVLARHAQAGDLAPGCGQVIVALDRTEVG